MSYIGAILDDGLDGLGRAKKKATPKPVAPPRQQAKAERVAARQQVKADNQAKRVVQQQQRKEVRAQQQVNKAVAQQNRQATRATNQANRAAQAQARTAQRQAARAAAPVRAARPAGPAVSKYQKYLSKQRWAQPGLKKQATQARIAVNKPAQIARPLTPALPSLPLTDAAAAVPFQGPEQFPDYSPAVSYPEPMIDVPASDVFAQDAMPSGPIQDFYDPSFDVDPYADGEAAEPIFNDFLPAPAEGTGFDPLDYGGGESDITFAQDYAEPSFTDFQPADAGPGFDPLDYVDAGYGEGGGDGFYVEGLGIFKSIGKAFKKVGKSVGKVVKKAAPIVGGFAGGGLPGAIVAGGEVVAASKGGKKAKKAKPAPQWLKDASSFAVRLIKDNAGNVIRQFVDKQTGKVAKQEFAPEVPPAALPGPSSSLPSWVMPAAVAGAAVLLLKR